MIPGNDDALRSINLYKNYFLETIKDATNFQDEDNVLATANTAQPPSNAAACIDINIALLSGNNFDKCNVGSCIAGPDKPNRP